MTRSSCSSFSRTAALALALWLASFGTAAGALRVTTLRCDGMHDPLGVDSTTPRLSWCLESVDRGARETAWQVQVASSLEALARGDADVWDSGRVSSAEQLEIPYAGRRLATAAQVFWRVRAWDEHGAASAWSEFATWTMGVVDPADWRAQWITDPELARSTRTKLGFSTPPTTDPQAAAWVAVDLGHSEVIDEIVLDALVHTVPERLGFPQWFKVELANSADFHDAVLVADHTGEGINVWLTRFAIAVPKVTARFVRLTAPRLRAREEEAVPQPVRRLALRQIEIKSAGRNVAVGATVTASASVEDGRWSAAALVDGREIPGADPHAAETLLARGEFKVDRPVHRALLFISGLGTYTVALNGTEFGRDEFQKPGWSDPARTCFYNTFDLSPALRPGPNVIGVTLAGGMYNVPAAPGRYTKFVSAPRPLTVLAQLRIEYADGRTETIGTGEGWIVAPGPTTFAHEYGGEDYDARRDPVGWDRPEYQPAGWRTAVVITGPGGILRGASRSAPPMVPERVLPVIVRRELRPGVAVYDLGQNAALLPEVTVHGPAGAVVKISPAELLRPDGSIDPASTRPAKSDASWSYTLAGRREGETWRPRFFYHGARYLQVECTATNGEPPVVDRLVGVAVHSDSRAIGEFSCSNELLNRIATLVRWAQANNLAYVLTDCPHRERLGWLEQYHLNGPSLRYNFDLARLYAKGFGDMTDAQRANGLVPDIAPEYIQFAGGFRDSPEWGSALILAAIQQYVWTGRLGDLRRNYPAMKRYFGYLTSRARDHLLDFGLGDWYDVGPGHPGLAQLTPIALTATAIYYEDARALARIASELGRTEDAAKYAAEADQIAAAFNTRFFDRHSLRYATGSQTAHALPLALGLAPNPARAAVLTQLVDDVQSHGNAVTAGDIGYRYLLRALAGGHRSDVVFDLNAQTAHPGYGYQIAHGATSLTEAWDANRASSQDHFMLGQIVEWLYGAVAGLAPDPEAPGFAAAIIRPTPVGDLTWAKANVDTVRGPFMVRWEVKDGEFRLEVVVPANALARVELPVRATAAVRENGQAVSTQSGVSRVADVDGRPAFRVGAGRYEFSVNATELQRDGSATASAPTSSSP